MPAGVLVVGTVAFDVIETPWESARGVLGGSATYVTLAARLSGEPVGLVAVVGRDFTEAHMAVLSTRGVDLAGLQVDHSGKTFAWGGRYTADPNHRTTLFTELNVLAAFTPRVPDSFLNSRIVCLGNLDPRIQLSVMEEVLNPDLTVCDTMNYWIANASASLRRVLQRVDCLVINDEEARQIAGHHNLISAARDIRAMGPRILVIKKGEHGAIMFTGESVFVTPAFPVSRVKDPTGAGDSFLGGFCGQLACERTISDAALRRAVLRGTVMASFAVEHLGTNGLMNLEQRDIRQRLHVLRRAVAWPAGW